jgi:hypothetical protein
MAAPAACPFTQSGEQSSLLDIGKRKFLFRSACRRDQLLLQIAQAAFFGLSDQIAI